MCWHLVKATDGLGMLPWWCGLTQVRPTRRGRRAFGDRVCRSIGVVSKPEVTTTKLQENDAWLVGGDGLARRGARPGGGPGRHPTAASCTIPPSALAAGGGVRRGVGLHDQPTGARGW